jgi:cytochrome P450
MDLTVTGGSIPVYLNYYFLLQGHDTTSAGICWALLLLGSHPDIQVCHAWLQVLQTHHQTVRCLAQVDSTPVSY